MLKPLNVVKRQILHFTIPKNKPKWISRKRNPQAKPELISRKKRMKIAKQN